MTSTPGAMESTTGILLMKWQLVVTHQYTVLQEPEKTRQIINRPTVKHVMFLQKY
jgi:hypothetical protein